MKPMTLVVDNTAYQIFVDENEELKLNTGKFKYCLPLKYNLKGIYIKCWYRIQLYTPLSRELQYV